MGAMKIFRGAKAGIYRITHIFSAHIYLMRVTTGAAAHDATRPKRWLLSDIVDLVARGNAAYGSVSLPPELTNPLAKDSEEYKAVKALEFRIAPLLQIFRGEPALGRTFTGEIRSHAKLSGIPLPTLRRTLLRYWYFGGIPQALLDFKRGPKKFVDSRGGKTGNAGTPHQSAGLRPGRKPYCGEGVRICDWRPNSSDVEDMETAAKRCANLNKRGLQSIVDEYLAREFKRAHPTLHDQFTRGVLTEPCTVRQLRYRLRKRAALHQTVLDAFPTLGRRALERALKATGSGHIYELDATGGQIYIVDSKDPTRILRKVTIYLLIDRYSRYVVSAYITAKAPSSEGVRQALRIAFTSRTPRFANLGCNITDEEWPPGVIPLIMVVDNGPDMISKATLELAVGDLQIDVNILPPYTPDGKAIIERFIRTLKIKMNAKGLAGLYKKIQFSPSEKESAKNAVFLAELSLRSLYRELVELIREYNHGYHKGLEQLHPELASFGVPFTPISAYKYGLENVSGLAQPALTDEDIFQLTLTPEKASIKQGVISRKGHSYWPSNSQAQEVGLALGSSRKTIDIKLDRNNPVEVFSTASTTPFPSWKLDERGISSLSAMGLEDWEEFAEERATLKADTLRSSTIKRVIALEASAPRPVPRRTPKAAKNADLTNRRSVQESNDVDAALNARGPTRPGRTEPSGKSPNSSYRDAEDKFLEDIVGDD